MHVHFIAVAGTGMGALAGLFKAAGHDVSGSDVAFYPPMGPALRRWGVRLFEGFDPGHLAPRPDLVVVGNVCRPWNEEARAAIDGGMRYASMVDALVEHILPGTSSLVVGGTHGKTTTSALCAWLLDQAQLGPGFLIGGLPANFEHSFRLADAAPAPGLDAETPAAPRPQRATPFVIEGDEYDTAFFDKTPKFWHYRPQVAIVTSIEHDHIDIYPDEESYLAAFRGFVERVPPGGLIVAHAADRRVAELVSVHARAEVSWYALEGDEMHGLAPHWLATPAPLDGDRQSFRIFASGMLVGRGSLALAGEFNVRNALAALAAVCQGYGVPTDAAISALGRFAGVRRRQDLRGQPRGIRVYDDFAHHPTAVAATLRGLRARHPQGTLWAVYEPRSATACRALHQQAYETAFDAADRVLLAPLGRSSIPTEERLDLPALVGSLTRRGRWAAAAESIDAIVELLCEQARAGDTIALLSNGSFGGIHDRLLQALAAA